MPGLDHVRSQSLFGLSDVKCYFKWGTDYKDARQEVINRLQFVQLPPAFKRRSHRGTRSASCSATPSRARATRSRSSKTAEDWILERQWRMVPGVVDVTSFGGETKQFHIKVDPYRLKGHGVTLTQLTTAVQNANINGGGQRLEIGEQSYDIRGVGLLRNTHDIEDIVIVDYKGTPVRVRDVAEVDVGFAPRLGMVGIDDRPDVVQGIVLMRYGAETKPTLEGIHAKVDYIREEPPPAAGHAHQAVLRPRRSRRPDHAHGDGERRHRHRAGRARAAVVPRQHPRGADHRAEHPARAARRVHRHGVHARRRRT